MAEKKASLRFVEKGKYSLDARGYTCPYPEVLARRALEAIASGDVLELFTDNVPSCESIPAAAEELGHKVLEVSKVEENVWKIAIQKL